MSAHTWRLTISVADVQITPGPAPYVWVVEGADPWPFLEALAPAPPPDPPPPVDPPPVTDEDAAPFVWPPEWQAPTDASQRTQWWWLIPGRREDEPTVKCYVYLAEAGNNIGAQHHNAGIIQAGRFQGSRLWAPHDAPAAMLRQIICTGVWP